VVDKDFKKLKNELEIIQNGWDSNENYHRGEDGTLYEESYIRKMLSNSLDIFTDWSLSLGNHHFGITINMPHALCLSWGGISHFDYDTTIVSDCGS
jgi:hypothetical protein